MKLRLMRSRMCNLFSFRYLWRRREETELFRVHTFSFLTVVGLAIVWCALIVGQRPSLQDKDLSAERVGTALPTPGPEATLSPPSSDFLEKASGERDAASDVCDYYVDNTAEDGGDGSWDSPWTDIHGQVDDLFPGDTLCVRGNLMLPSRVYTDYIHLRESDVRDGTAEQPITVRAFPGEQVTIRFSDAPLVRFRDVAYWHIEGFVFDGERNEEHVVEFSDAHDNVLRRCEITGGRGYGVRLRYSDHNVIEYCEIHAFDKGPYADAYGIMLTDSNDNFIRRNEIYDCRGDTIHFGPTGSQGNVIEENHLYTTLGRCSENAIDVKGGSVIIRDNAMHGFRANDGSCGGSGSGAGAAVLIHDDAVNVTIEDNTIFDSASGIRLLKGEHVRVIGNVVRDIVYDPNAWADFGIQAHRAMTMEIHNNTFVDVPQIALLIGMRSGLSLYNNLFVNTGQIVLYNRGSAQADYNGWFNATDQLVGSHDIFGDDPRFVSPGDYRLRADSPALDAGLDVGLPYVGQAPDLGAYEFRSIAPAAVTDLRITEAITSAGALTLTLQWTATGDDGWDGTAMTNTLRSHERLISDSNWAVASELATLKRVRPAGTRESYTVYGMPWNGDMVWYALRVGDDEGLWSRVSNPALFSGNHVYLPLIVR